MYLLIAYFIGALFFGQSLQQQLAISQKISAGGGTPAITLNNHTVAKSSNGGNSVVTSSLDVTGSTLLHACVVSYNVNTRPTVTDNATSPSNTWTALTDRAVSNVRVTEFYVANPHTLSNLQLTVSGTSSFPSVALDAWNNIITSSPQDQQNGQATGSASSLATGNITPGNNNQLITTCVGFAAVQSTAPAATGYSPLDFSDYTNGQAFGVANGYQIQTTATTVSPNWGWTNATNAAVSVSSYKNQ